MKFLSQSPALSAVTGGVLLLAALAGPTLALARPQSPADGESVAEASPRSGDVPNPHGPLPFLRVGAARLGVPASDPQLVVERVEGPLRFPEAGLEVWVASVLRGPDEKATVALSASGDAVDLELAATGERLLAAARRGKLSAALFERAIAAPQLPLRVAAWLDVPDVDAARLEHGSAIEALEDAGELTEMLVDSHLEELARKVRASIAPATAAFAAELEARGLPVGLADQHAPLVFFEADLATMLDVARDGRVLELDEAVSEFAPRLSNAYKEVRADKLYASYPWADANYSRVGIVEGGRPCEGTWLDVAEFRQGGSNSSHTTGVAGCVASSHDVHSGVARGARIYAANGASMSPGSTYTFGFQGSVDAISWAISRGCHIMNLSYGANTPNATVTGFDKYLDYVARTSAKTLAIACGNSGAYAGDPGAGFNQVAVGNFSDGNDYDWIGEGMASSSSWQNPSTGVETPQLAAPGTGLNMLDCSNGTGYFASGTSFSAPIVAGIAALLVDRQPSLGGWPEPVRAILMATAWHNIEGSSKLSAKDGAGGADAYAAYRVASRGKGWGYQYGTLTASSFDSSKLYTAQTVYISAGTKVRACLSFDSQVKKSGFFGIEWFDSTLASDLDFRAYGPTGSFVASSSSSIQPFEMLEFTASTSGYYSFKIRNWSFGPGAEYFGTAVSLSTDKGE